MNADSVRLMTAIDSLPPDWRALVHEFGWVTVRDMRADGWGSARKVREVLAKSQSVRRDRYECALCPKIVSDLSIDA